MWSMEIQKAGKEQGRAIISGVFTESVSGETLLKQYVLDGFGNLPSLLKQRIQNDLDAFNAAYAFADTIVPGAPDLTPIVKPPLTPQQIAQNKFITDFQVQRGMEKAIASGIKKTTDQDYIDQVALVKLEFLPEYAPLINAMP